MRQEQLQQQSLRQLRLKLCQNNEKQKLAFQTIISQHGQINFKSSEYYHLLFQGIPADFRKIIWPQLVPNIHGVTTTLYNTLNEQQRQLKYSKLVKDRYSHNKQNSQMIIWFNTLEMDINRTFPELKIYGNTDSEQSKQLNNILSVFCLFRQDIGYIQGMSQICALLLQQCICQYTTFTIFSSLIITDTIYEFYTFNHQNIEYFCLEVEQKLKLKDDQLHKLIHQQDVDYKIFIFSWIITLFTRVFSLDSVLRIWDIMFVFQFNRFILRQICVCLILGYRKKIFEGDRDQCLKIIQQRRLNQHEEENVIELIQSIAINH